MDDGITSQHAARSVSVEKFFAKTGGGHNP